MKNFTIIRSFYRGSPDDLTVMPRHSFTQGKVALRPFDGAHGLPSCLAANLTGQDDSEAKVLNILETTRVILSSSASQEIKHASTDGS